MIKILIVDDSFERVNLIKEAIVRATGKENSHFDVATYSNKARTLIANNIYDILILDIVLPRHDGEALIIDEGITLLNDILAKKHKYYIPQCIIGTSAHEGPATEAQQIFMKRVYQFIPFTILDEEFSDIIYKRISEFFSAYASKHDSLDCDCTIGVVCALEEELSFLLKNGWKWEVFYDKTYRKFYLATIRGKIGDITIVATRSHRMGILHASISAYCILNKYNVKYLSMTGIAASTSPECNYGDILIGNPLWDWSVGKWKHNGENLDFIPEPYQCSLDIELNNKLDDFVSKQEIFMKIYFEWSGAKPKNQLSAIIAPFASGPSVIASTEMREKILEQHRKVLGIDMECYALFEVARNSSQHEIKVFTMKSIVDYADETKSDTYHSYACYTSASAFKYFVELYID